MSTIPKIIHFCWFGGSKIPSKMQEYVDGWKIKCPEYEIKRWDESNFDIDCCRYVSEAYKNKKWAFVSDYARFKILYEYGGVYFDTDVEMIKSIDNIVENGPFLGMETDKQIAPGLGMAAYPKMDYCKKMMEIYDSLYFDLDNNTSNMKTICDYTTEFFISKGLKSSLDTIQIIEGVCIYPKDYFNPYNLETGKIEITPNTVTIHHYAGSWVDQYSKFRGQVYYIIRKMLGKKGADLFQKVFGRKG